MIFRIEKGIPLPAKGGKPSKYPFGTMMPGDSFLVPIDEASPSSVYGATKLFQLKNPGWKFSQRLIDKEKGTRVWCLEKPKAAAPTAPEAAVEGAVS